MLYKDHFPKVFVLFNLAFLLFKHLLHLINYRKIFLALNFQIQKSFSSFLNQKILFIFQLLQFSFLLELAFILLNFQNQIFLYQIFIQHYIHFLHFLLPLLLLIHHHLILHLKHFNHLRLLTILLLLLHHYLIMNLHFHHPLHLLLNFKDHFLLKCFSFYSLYYIYINLLSI